MIGAKSIKPSQKYPIFKWRFHHGGYQDSIHPWGQQPTCDTNITAAFRKIWYCITIRETTTNVLIWVLFFSFMPSTRELVLVVEQLIIKSRCGAYITEIINWDLDQFLIYKGTAMAIGIWNQFLENFVDYLISTLQNYCIYIKHL